MWNLFLKKIEKTLVTFRGYIDKSNKGLTYPYTFSYIIILTYRKIYFPLYKIGKKNYYEKVNIFTCRIVLLLSVV